MRGSWLPLLAIAALGFLGPLSAASGQEAAPSCGGPGMPPCPLQAWMRTRLGAPLAQRDLVALAVALDQLGAAAPEGYEGWAAQSKAGADAAREGDLAKTRAACRSCHEAHRDRYRKERRGAPAPP